MCLIIPAGSGSLSSSGQENRGCLSKMAQAGGLRTPAWGSLTPEGRELSPATSPVKDGVGTFGSRNEGHGDGEGGLTTYGIDLSVQGCTGVVRAGLQHGCHRFPDSFLQRETPGLGG